MPARARSARTTEGLIYEITAGPHLQPDTHVRAYALQLEA